MNKYKWFRFLNYISHRSLLSLFIINKDQLATTL